MLLLGFTEFYIEPNNNFDIDYSNLKHTKTEFKDSIKINQGIGIITIRNGETPFLNTKFTNISKSNINKAEIDKVVNMGTLTTEAIKSIKKLTSVYSYLKSSDSIRDFLEQDFIQKEFVQLILQFKTALPRMSSDVSNMLFIN